MSFDQSLGADDLMMAEAIVELQSTFEEAVTILRAGAPQSLPGQRGTPKKLQFVQFQATAVLVELGVAKNIFEAGVFSAGDIVLQMRERLNEATGIAQPGGSFGSGQFGGGPFPGSVSGDRVVWRGAQYRMVQRSQPEKFGASDVFYHVLLRRVNDKTDVTGQ